MLARILSFWLVIVTTSTFTLGTETYFEITDNEDNRLFGTIVSLNRTQIVVNVQETTRTIPIEKLVKIRNIAQNPYESGSTTNANASIQPTLGRNANERRLATNIISRLQSNDPGLQKTFPGSAVALELKDSTQLTASAFTIANNQGVCRLLEQENDLSLPLSDISAVRLAVRSLSDVLNPSADWLRLAVPNTDGDRLIVGNPGAFDVYTGILGDVSAETVSFTVDGEVLPIPRRRVFGLVLHGKTTFIPNEQPLAALMLWTGTRGMVSDFQLSESELTWQTTTGLTLTVPLDAVSEINFNESGIADLVDFEQMRSEFTLPFASAVQPEQLRMLQTFFESRAHTVREVILDGVAYERGMTLLGESSLEYRLPKPFSELRAVIGIEDQFRPHASASLQIFADSQILGTWELRGDAAAQRIVLNLPQQCRLIRIVVKSFPSLGGSTVLTIGNARLLE